jgi:pilus assembly protein CpaC
VPVLCAIVALALTTTMTTTTAHAQPESPTTRPANDSGSTMLVTQGLDNGVVRLMANKSVVLRTSRPYKRVSIAQPDVADVNPVGERGILLTAKKAGSTQLVLWDDDDRSQMIDVVVNFDIDAVRDQFKTTFPDAKIDVGSANGTIVLRGVVPTLTVAQQAEQVAAPYGKVLNFLEVSGGQQVMLQVKIAEVSRAATTALGVNLFAADGAFVGGSNVGQINPITSLLQGNVGDTPGFRGIDILEPHTISPSVTLFGAGQIGSFYLEAFVQAMRQNNLLRVLAEPNLVAISGQEASFLAGGEFPIPVPGGGVSGGTSSVTIEFREFGVKLNFVPVVTGEGKIRLKVAPEVSDLDFSTAVRFQGFVVPGLTQRKVTTTIELGDGQSFAIAGLLNNNVTANKEVTPLLGDLPVIGTLFRSVRYQRKETELLVLVTPRIVAPMNPGQLPPVPGENWRHPRGRDLFWKQDLGGEAKDDGSSPSKTTRPKRMSTSAQPPRFFGEHGFQPADATVDR